MGNTGLKNIAKTNTAQTFAIFFNPVATVCWTYSNSGISQQVMLPINMAVLYL